MGLILLINSDKGVLDRVRTAYEQRDRRLDVSIRMVPVESRVQEAMNYDLPELVMVNCGDPKINLDNIIGHIRTDAWLHSFGIIGLYDSSRQDEEEIAQKFRDLNLLVLLDYNRIRSHLMKCVDIILENWQLIYQKEVSNRFMEKMSGSFVIENDTLSVPIYAAIPVNNLAQLGLLRPEDKMRLQLSLSELIINSIEHGNCGISYEEKTEGMERGLSVVELVAERCQDPAVASKKVQFSWDSGVDRTVFVIRDEGEGFDVEATRKKTAEQDMYSTHGRGIRMAESLSRELRYNAKGNEVTLVIDHAEGTARETPEGFSKEEVILTKPGDVIFREGEPGDFLYYISSGRFSVHHKGKQVGTLSPADIFMGEMSFLLNNRRSAAVVAREEGKLVKISRKSFVEVLKGYPHYGIFLSKLLARKLVRSNEERSA